jgi:hypothetical protein
VALADPSAGANAEFVTISKSGAVTSAKVIKDTPGDIIDLISCTRLTSCEVAGSNVFTSPASTVAGTWNGKKLSLRQVGSPKKTSALEVSAVSCYGSACDIVGFYIDASTDTGFSLTADGTRLGKPHTSPGNALTGVACASKSVCYAVGDHGHAAGIVITLKDGVPGTSQQFASDPSGIACGGTACTSVGTQLLQPSENFAGSLVSITAGKVTGTSTFITQSSGLTSVDRIGTFFAASGASQGSTTHPSVVVTG